MKVSPIRAALWLAVAAALALPAAAQQRTAAPEAKAPTAAQQEELDAARAQLDAAAKRYGELARKYGGDAPMRWKVEQQRLLRKPVIGVVLAPDSTTGVRIAGVTPDSAAAEAGLRSGDRIVAIDGKAIAGRDGDARVEVAREAIGKHDEKSKVRLRYLRDGGEKTVVLAPRPGERMLFLPAMPFNDGPEIRRNLKVFERPDGNMEFEGEDVHFDAIPAIAPDVRRELRNLRPSMTCDGKPCFPVISDALRWNGFNLAALDAGLGRYFGTDTGVLVLSTGRELDGLEAGDVIRSVDGKAVRSPRDVMEALRGRDAGSKVAVGYLRDRKAGTAQVTVPEPFRVPAPPAPPAPPVAPSAPPPPPSAAPMAPAAPRAPAFAAPAPPAAPTPPPPPPAPPVD